MSRLNVLVIDNFDSFTFNLVDDLRQRGAAVSVWRNEISAREAMQLVQQMPPPRLILLSPGPGRPEEAGCCQHLVELAKGQIPLFGVCLGLQAIVQVLGGEVGPAGAVVHGKSAWVEHDRRGIFSGLPSPLLVGRYHSLVARAVPEQLEVTARCGELVMAVAHRRYALAGVQFHPESILTPEGGLLIDRLFDWATREDLGDA